MTTHTKTTTPGLEARVCAWRGESVHARNGRTEPGDPDPCGRPIFWDEVSNSWLHTAMPADRDHKAIFGPVSHRSRAEMASLLAIASAPDRPVHERAHALLVAHQRRDIRCCLCGWAELGKSHAGHQVEMLDLVGLLATDTKES